MVSEICPRFSHDASVEKRQGHAFAVRNNPFIGDVGVAVRLLEDDQLSRVGRNAEKLAEVAKAHGCRLILRSEKASAASFEVHRAAQATREYRGL